MSEKSPFTGDYRPGRMKPKKKKKPLPDNIPGPRDLDKLKIKGRKPTPWRGGV